MSVPAPGNDNRCALCELISTPATWFDSVGDDEVIAFKQPLLEALAQPVALGQLASGPRAGTLVVIPLAPPADAGVARFTPQDPVDVVAVD